MRKFQLLFFLCITSSYISIAQIPAAMPPEADAFYTKAMPLIKPQLKNAILKVANSLRNRQANADSLSKALRSGSAFKGMSDQDMQGIITLIMVQASKDTDDDLKRMVLSMRNNNDVGPAPGKGANTKTRTRESADEERQLMLQMIMERKSKIAEEISFVIKKISDNSEIIINNLK